MPQHFCLHFDDDDGLYNDEQVPGLPNHYCESIPTSSLGFDLLLTLPDEDDDDDDDDNDDDDDDDDEDGVMKGMLMITWTLYWLWCC